MDLSANKVNPIACGKCGAQIDAADAEPLSSVACPRCQASVQVPVSLGNILLFKKLGEGASGVVYHALDQDLRRNIAVKIVHPGDEGPEPDAVLAEARAMAAVNHPNVVKIHTIGEIAGQPYIAMELLTGGKVQQMIDKRGKLSERRSVKVALDAAQGLRAAHLAGLRHQDVKPDNILLDEHANAKLLDFGFARFGGPSRTQTIIGTPAYVAPEIIEQEEADFRADIYSLGCTLYHMLTGRTPFGGETASGAYAAHLRETPRYLRETNPKIHTATADVTARMIQRNPDDRPQSYDELIEELTAAAAAIEAGPQDPDEPIIDQALREAAREARSGGPRRSMPTPRPGSGDVADRPRSRSSSSRRTTKVDHPTPKPRGSAASSKRVGAGGKSGGTGASGSTRARADKRKKKPNASAVLLIVLCVGAIALIGLIVLLVSLIMSGRKNKDEDARLPLDPPALVVVGSSSSSMGERADRIS